MIDAKIRWGSTQTWEMGKDQGARWTEIPSLDCLLKDFNRSVIAAKG